MFKRFISYYKPYKGWFFLDITCAFIVSISSLFFPYITKNIINIYIPNKDLNMIIIWCSALFAIFIFKGILNYIIHYYGHLLGVKIQGDMRRDLFRHIQRLPFSYLDSTQTGSLMSRLINDLFDVAELAHHGPEDLFLSFITLGGAFIMMALINPYLALIVFVAIPFIVFFASKSKYKMKSTFRKTKEATSKINAEIATSLTGIRVTRAYVQETHEANKFDDVNGNYKKIRGETYKATAIFMSIMSFASDFLYLLILVAGGLFFYYGKINTGEFSAFILYIAMILSPIRSLVAIYEQIENGMAGFKRFIEIMDESTEDDKGKPTLEVIGDIEFKDVNFSYSNGEKVLHDVNFIAKKGETTALVGESGSGKSTICHLILRFYDITSGKILIDNNDIEEYSKTSVRDKIGIVAQDVFIFEGSIFENIKYGKLDATDEEVFKAAKDAKLDEYIKSLPNGYDTQVGERGIKLSGGQKQRISIARAFLKNPPILILDEATSALDNKTEKYIQESLAALAIGRTVLVVAHRLSTIQNADKIVVIDEGHVAEIGKHEELIKNKGAYYTICANK